MTPWITYGQLRNPSSASSKIRHWWFPHNVTEQCATLLHGVQPVVIRNTLAYLNAQLTISRRPLACRVSDVFVAGVLAQPLVDAVSCPTSYSRTNDFCAYWNRKAHPLMYRLASSGNWWLPSRSSWDTCVYVEAVNLQPTLGQQKLHSYNLYLQAKATANPDSKGQVIHKGTECLSFTSLPSN